jgi:spore maturation protein CgeB
MGSNDIVALMACALGKMFGVTLITIDPKIYSVNYSEWINREGEINWLRDDRLLELVEYELPDVIICNAGGLSPSKKMHQWLGERNILRVGIALSDPDDFFVRSKYFSNYFNFFYTNSSLAIDYYRSIGVTAALLPFAADPNFNKPLILKYKYDLVIVGGKRPDRLYFVNRLLDSGIKVGCYGSGWIDERWPFKAIKFLLPFGHRKILRYFDFISEVHGEKQNLALNLAPIYLSFAATYAGFVNVKVGLFEAASAGACVLVQDFPELHKYFNVGEEIIAYSSLEDAVEKIIFLKNNLLRAQEVGILARQRVLMEHTWGFRWAGILNDIKVARA